MPQDKSTDRARYVVPNPRGGWDVVKAGHERASAHATTKAAAIDRGREIVRNLGGGELRIQNRLGRFIDSDTVPRGQESTVHDTK
jgi:hypothetical protein